MFGISIDGVKSKGVLSKPVFIRSKFLCKFLVDSDRGEEIIEETGWDRFLSNDKFVIKSKSM